jgi:hypothetical protein
MTTTCLKGTYNSSVMYKNNNNINKNTALVIVVWNYGFLSSITTMWAAIFKVDFKPQIYKLKLKLPVGKYKFLMYHFQFSFFSISF